MLDKLIAEVADINKFEEELTAAEAYMEAVRQMRTRVHAVLASRPRNARRHFSYTLVGRAKHTIINLYITLRAAHISHGSGAAIKTNQNNNFTDILSCYFSHDNSRSKETRFGDFQLDDTRFDDFRFGNYHSGYSCFDHFHHYDFHPYGSRHLDCRPPDFRLDDSLFDGTMTIPSAAKTQSLTKTPSRQRLMT